MGRVKLTKYLQFNYSLLKGCIVYLQPIKLIKPKYIIYLEYIGYKEEEEVLVLIAVIKGKCIITAPVVPTACLRGRYASTRLRVWCTHSLTRLVHS